MLIHIHHETCRTHTVWNICSIRSSENGMWLAPHWTRMDTNISSKHPHTCQPVVLWNRKHTKWSTLSTYWEGQLSNTQIGTSQNRPPHDSTCIAIGVVDKFIAEANRNSSQHYNIKRRNLHVSLYDILCRNCVSRCKTPLSSNFNCLQNSLQHKKQVSCCGMLATGTSGSNKNTCSVEASASRLPWSLRWDTAASACLTSDIPSLSICFLNMSATGSSPDGTREKSLNIRAMSSILSSTRSAWHPLCSFSSNSCDIEHGLTKIPTI